MLAAKRIARLLLRAEFFAETVRIRDVLGLRALFTFASLSNVRGIVGTHIEKSFAWPANGLAMQILEAHALEFPTHHGHVYGQVAANLAMAADAKQEVLKAVAGKVFEIGSGANRGVPKPLEVLGDQPVAKRLASRPRFFACMSARKNEQGGGVCGGFFDSPPDVSDIALGLSALEVEQIPAVVLGGALKVMHDGMAGNDDGVPHRSLERLGDTEGVRIRTRFDGAVGQEADQGWSGTG